MKKEEEAVAKEKKFLFSIGGPDIDLGFVSFAQNLQRFGLIVFFLFGLVLLVPKWNFQNKLFLVFSLFLWTGVFWLLKSKDYVEKPRSWSAKGRMGFFQKHDLPIRNCLRLGLTALFLLVLFLIIPQMNFGGNWGKALVFALLLSFAFSWLLRSEEFSPRKRVKRKRNKKPEPELIQETQESLPGS